MDALKQLEFRILEELSDVHEIQKKLVKSKLAKDADEDAEDFFEQHQSNQGRSRLLTEADACEKTLSHLKSVSKSRFSKNPNLIVSPKKSVRSSKENCRPANAGFVQQEARQDRKFQPSFHILQEKQANYQSTETPKAPAAKKSKPPANRERHLDRRNPKTPSKHGKKPVSNRRWSMADNEDPGQLETDESKLPTEFSSNEIVVVNGSKKRPTSSKQIASPIRSRQTRSPSAVSIQNSRRKEPPSQEYTFRPQLSAKSMAIAKGLVAWPDSRNSLPSPGSLA